MFILREWFDLPPSSSGFTFIHSCFFRCRQQCRFDELRPLQFCIKQTCVHLFRRGKRLCDLTLSQSSCISSTNFCSFLQWFMLGKAMVACAKPQQWKKEESKRLRGERCKMMRSGLRFEREQVIGLEKGRLTPCWRLCYEEELMIPKNHLVCRELFRVSTAIHFEPLPLISS